MQPIYYPFAALTLLAAATGCGGDLGPPLVAVRGVMTLDGKPLAAKTVQFVPEPGTPGVGGGATSAADGSFQLIAARPGAVTDTKGIPPGDYRVVVTEPMFPLEEPLPQAEGDAPAAAVGLADLRRRRPSAVPSRYSSLEQTPLRIQVTTSDTIDLQLSTGN